MIKIRSYLLVAGIFCFQTFFIDGLTLVVRAENIPHEVRSDTQTPNSSNDADQIQTLQDRLALYHARQLAVVKNLRDRIHFTVSESMEYDDNIFATGSNQGFSNNQNLPKASDVIATTNLRLGFDFIKINRGSKRLLRNFTLGAEYLLNYQVFMSHHEETQLTQFVSPTLTAPLEWQSGDGKVILVLRDDFRPDYTSNDVFTDPGSNYQNNSNTYGPQDRQVYPVLRNYFDAQLTYRESGRGSIGWNYHNSWVYYLKNRTHNGSDSNIQNLNSIEHSTGPTFSYLLGPRTSLFANGSVSWTTYLNNNSGNNNNNSVSYRVLGGIKRRVAAKTNVSFSAGYEWYETRGSGERSSGPIFNASYDQVISPRTTWGLHASHQIYNRRNQTNNIIRTQTLEQIANADNNEVVTNTSLSGYLVHFLGPKLSLSTNDGISLEKDTGNQSGGNNSIFFYSASTLQYYFTHHWTGDLTYLFTTERGNQGSTNGNNQNYVRNRYIATIRYQF